MKILFLNHSVPRKKPQSILSSVLYIFIVFLRTAKTAMKISVYKQTQIAVLIFNK